MSNKNDYTGLACLGVICIFICLLIFSLMLIIGLTWLICMGFGFNFSVWLGLGVWAIIVLFGLLVSIVK